MARVPDLGSDFSQKLLQDLRRRRERLGFESSPPAPAQRTSTSSSAAVPCDVYSNSQSQRPLRSQKQQQGAPRAGRPEAASHRPHPQSSNAIVRAKKPARHDAPAVAHSHAIVPFQGGGGGGGGSKQQPANSFDVQMALALALSNGGKLQNIELVPGSDGSVFFGEPAPARHGREDGYLQLPHRAHVGKVAIGVQKLNEVLMAYSSGAPPGAGGFGRRSSGEIGRRLLRGAMDLEESLSMLVMLQEASDYMEGSGNGKVLLLKGKENKRRSSSHSPSSARLVEIVDDDSEAEHAIAGDGSFRSSNTFMQIVAHKNPQSFDPNKNSALQLSILRSNSKNNVSRGEKDDSNVRMPSVIAKLMGLENLPSTKVIAEHKGTEKFVKLEAVAKKGVSANMIGSKLPIRIVASERVSTKGQHKNLLGRKWEIGLTNSEESESVTVLSKSSLFPTVDKQARQTMRQLLSKAQITERRGGEIKGVNEKIVHERSEKIIREDKKLTEDSKLQKAVSVGCRTDAARKMDFLKRFRKNSETKPATEDKPRTGEKNRTDGNKQTLLGRGSDAKSRRKREKFNKENHATTENKTARSNVKKDHIRRPAHINQTDKQSMANKGQNYKETQSEAAIQNLSLKPEATHLKNKFACTEEMLQENNKHRKINDIGYSRPLETTHDDVGISGSVSELKDRSTTGVASSGQSAPKTPDENNDPTIAIVQTSDHSIVSDQITTSEINDGTIKHTSSEAIQGILETFPEGEQQQHQHQQIIVKEKTTDGSDHTTKSGDPAGLQDHKTRVVSCDSFTDKQLLIMTLLMKDQYLLETAMAIVRVHDPVNFMNATATEAKWLYKDSELHSDIGREVIRRKSKRTEAMVEVSMVRAANLKLQYLDDLIRELDDDIESLDISNKPGKQSDDNTAENLRMILQADIQNNHPDANSMWDFGWNRISDLPVEKNEVVKDLEKNILGGIITDLARELIEVSVRRPRVLCV